VAKFCGIRVEAFSLGFGPRLFGFKYGDTDYKVCLLPLGGFVKMTGENPGEEDTANDPRAFTSHPRWQRMLIGVAGPVANFILAFVLMAFYFTFINEVPSVKSTSVEWVAGGSAAAQAGFQPGDVIQRFDTVDNPSWGQTEMRAYEKTNETVPITVERNGASVQLALHLPTEIRGKDYDISQAGLFLELEQGPVGVDQVLPDSPAARSGLHNGDSILAVDGHPFHSVIPLLSYLQSGQGKPVTLTVSRGGATIAPLVVQPTIQDSEWRLGFLNAPAPEVPTYREPLPFSTAVAKSEDFCVENSTVIVDVVGRLLTHRVSVTQLSGPVGIARMAGQAAEMKGWMPKFGLAGMISLNLGILNLMPFPILDGGLILLLMIESVMRRDINMVVKERIYQAAFVVLVAFAAFIIFNDVSKIRAH
jgi:regulator of sigma E protease